MHEFLIDWLQFTIKDKTYLEVIISILQYDFNFFQKMEKGMMGYKSQVAFDDIKVLFDGTADMGVHVIFSGKGCRQHESKESILRLLDRINASKGKLTRIDIALDDHTGDLIPFRKIKKDIIKGNIVTRWKSSVEFNKRDTDGKILGETISLGSRTSDTYIRIYDKALEQRTEGVWNRIELEIKKKNAEEVQRILAERTIPAIFKGVLNNYLRIVIPNENDTNKARWKTRPYWEKIINDIDKIKLSQKAEEKTVDETKAWLKRQIAPSLAVVSITENGDDTFFKQLIEDAIEELKPKHQRMILNEIHKKKQMKEELEQLIKKREKEKGINKDAE